MRRSTSGNLLCRQAVFPLGYRANHDGVFPGGGAKLCDRNGIDVLFRAEDQHIPIFWLVWSEELYSPGERGRHFRSGCIPQIYEIVHA